MACMIYQKIYVGILSKELGNFACYIMYSLFKVDS